MTHKLKFEISEASLGNVWLDGKEISVTEIRYRAKAGNIAEVNLTIVAEVEGEVTFEHWSNVKTDEPQKVYTAMDGWEQHSK